MRRLFCAIVFSISCLISGANPFIRLQKLQELNNCSIRTIYQDTNGAIIINAREGRFRYDGYSLEFLGKGEQVFDRERQHVDESGRIYQGSGHGLLSISPEGVESEVSLQGSTGLPVTCVFADSDKNIWIGTYYNGVFFKGAHGDCIDFVETPGRMKNLRSLVTDSRGNVWVFTDNSGAYSCDRQSGIWKEHESLRHRKFQNAFYDAHNDRIWACDTENGLICIDPKNGSILCYNMEQEDIRRFSYAMIWANGRLYLGGEDGLCVFRPSATGESLLVPMVNIKGPVYDMVQDENGKIWIAGNGIFTFDGEEVIREDGQDILSHNMCHDIDIDKDGNIWIALTEIGVAQLKDGEITIYDKNRNGLSSNFVNTVTCTDAGDVVVGSQNGISIFTGRDRKVFNFGENIGIVGNSPSGRPSILLPDGTVWIGNQTGITVYSGKISHPEHSKPAVIYKILVNGKEYTDDANQIVLNHKQNNISFSVSDFDYEKILPMSFDYFSKGKEAYPVPLVPGSPLTFSEMSAGRHDMTLRQKDINTGIQTYTGISIRLKRAWYWSRFAQICYLLLMIAIAAGILQVRMNKRILEDKLRKSEEEKEKSSMFFVDLSYNIRTPLNIIIGMFEKYFRDYGRRSTGAEQLDEIYQNATKIRELLSAHIDSIDVDSNKDDKASEGIHKNARFINAVTGSIERQLFSGEKVDVGTLCKEMHIGKTMLTAKLKEACGMTPRQFIEDVKLKHAHTLLQDGNMRVSEIAALLNFSSPGYFASKFKSRFGYPPSSTNQITSSQAE